MSEKCDRCDGSGLVGVLGEITMYICPKCSGKGRLMSISEELLKCSMGLRNYVLAMSAELAKKNGVYGSFSCPICGIDTPHAHNEFQIEEYLNTQRERFGLKPEELNISILQKQNKELRRVWKWFAKEMQQIVDENSEDRFNYSVGNMRDMLKQMKRYDKKLLPPPPAGKEKV